jgi:N-acetylmuramoyl-L-alanine amidase CwlA
MKITEMLLTPNKWSRPQDKLGKVKGIVIHWVANPNSKAESNRNFFEKRKDGKNGFGSAHYIVDLDGSVIRCLPESEMSYHVGSHVYTSQALKKLSTYPNNCTIGIECTHIDEKGKMTDATYNSALELAVSLLKKYGLTENDLWLHYTVVGWKQCHQWFVDNPDEWVKFKTKAGEMLRGKANLNPEVDTKDIHAVDEKEQVIKPQPKPTVKPVAKPTVTPSKAPTKAVSSNPVLKYSSTGKDVEKLQQILKDKGYHIVVDGDFGSKTADAVKEFQRANKLTQDGIVGEDTWKKLLENPKLHGIATGDVWLHSKADTSEATRTEILKEGSKVDILSGGTSDMHKTDKGFVSKKYILLQKA